MPIDDHLAALAGLTEAPEIDGDLEVFATGIEPLQPAIAAAVLAGLPLHELPPGDMAALRHSLTLVRDRLSLARLECLLTRSRYEAGIVGPHAGAPARRPLR